MDDTSGSEPSRKDFCDLNADMLHAIMELVSDGIWDWNANTPWKTAYSPGKT